MSRCDEQARDLLHAADFDEPLTVRLTLVDVVQLDVGPAALVKVLQHPSAERTGVEHIKFQFHKTSPFGDVFLSVPYYTQKGAMSLS